MIENYKDYSSTCSMNDDDLSNPCIECKYFCFPIGCMYGVDIEEMYI